MTLSIIIVSYNVKFFLEQCLRSCIKSTQNIEVEIIVVDNNSVDETASMVKEKFPSVSLICNHTNVGFSRANNQAISKSKGDFILLLNPDTIVEEDAIEKAIFFMANDNKVGAIGVHMVDGTGRFLDESKRGIPDFLTSLFKFVGLYKIFPRSGFLNKYYLGNLNKNDRNQVEVLVGAFMLIRRSVLNKVGLLDEQFFMYWEDTDLSMRITKNGYKNYYLGDIKIIHYKGESNKRHTLSFTIGFNKSMISFVKKHFSDHLLFLPLIKIATFFKFIFVLFRDVLNIFLLPIIDFIVMYSGILYLTKYWGQNYAQFPFNKIFTDIVLTSYIIIWIVSLFFSGAYDKPFRINRVARGVIFGLLVIATLSNFINFIRFSRVLILFGAVLVFFLFVFLRFLYRIMLNQDLDIAEKKSKNLLLISDEIEYNRAIGIINESKHNTKIIGYINENADKGALGSFKDLDDIIRKFKVNELVFASSDFSFKEIIRHHISLSDRLLDFKILPENSNFLIGSNSRETLGDYYSFDSNWELSKDYNKRNKRVIDIVFALLFLITSPFVMWFSKSPSLFLKNMVLIIKAKRTFVGFNNKYESYFPNIRKGILFPTSVLENNDIESKEIRNINMRYAKDYRARNDIYIILKCINQLG